ncbi:hypothetical protein GGX14DRAFT_517407 [Mycena pura]|uniref:GLTSCR protein conserved domain-containing protein n=1 Tax=Mycena pura TaxID=153505 RepID=A0AAD6YHQ2_9AGAR|nr:hypothetical protein GGX14DRAFT_517407 [Mycena pura]
MSNAFQSSLPSSSSSSHIDQSSPAPNFSPASAVSFSVPLHGRSSFAIGNGTWKPPANWNLHAPHTKKVPKAKKRTQEEEEITKRTAARVAARLAQDHAAVLNPDTETPFTDTIDVVNRLLPYHVFYQPKEDLDRKGKRKANDDLRAEIAETRFALKCFRRKQKLEERFRRVRIRSGERLAPDDQAVVLAQAVLDADRAENSRLNSELREARADLDKVEREKRAHIARSQPTPSVSQQYYRYPISYAQQPYGQAAAFTSPTPAATTSNTIPVQVPVASLPALHALGIQPVAAGTLVPGAIQPPAVLRGSSVDGTMLNLDINVSLLQSATGLAMMLNSLLTRQ